MLEIGFEINVVEGQILKVNKLRESLGKWRHA